MLVLGLASSGLGLDVTGLVNNHCHVYHVIINCVSVTITVTIATTTRFPPPAKKSRVSLFEHYSTSQTPAADERQLERQLAHYMDYINASSFSPIAKQNTRMVKYLTNRNNIESDRSIARLNCL